MVPFGYCSFIKSCRKIVSQKEREIRGFEFEIFAKKKLSDRSVFEEHGKIIDREEADWVAIDRITGEKVTIECKNYLFSKGSRTIQNVVEKK